MTIDSGRGELWPVPSRDVAAAIRSVAETLLAATERVTDEIVGPSLAGLHEPAISSDPALVEGDRRALHAEVVQWLTSNIQHPGRRVRPHMGADALQFYADLRRRGLEPDFVGGWRSALLVAWRRWTQQCLAQIPDPDVLADTLAVSVESFVQFAIDSITALRTAAFDDAVQQHDQQLLRTVHRLMREDQPPAELSELHDYRLGVTHTAAVVWSESPERGQVLDEAVARLLEALACRRSLVVNASSTTRWLWLATGADLAVDALRQQVTEPTGARLAFGRPGSGIDGFRRSHREAVATQGVLTRLTSPHTVARYSDVSIVDALTRDREHADEFVRTTLGDLAFADRDLRLTLLTYIQSGFSATRTAERLFAHRNTVERRVARADALSATKLADGPAQIAAALLVRHLQDSPP